MFLQARNQGESRGGAQIYKVDLIQREIYKVDLIQREIYKVDLIQREIDIYAILMQYTMLPCNKILITLC